LKKGEEIEKFPSEITSVLSKTFHISRKFYSEALECDCNKRVLIFIYLYSMGNLFSSLLSKLFGARDIRILILGLDGAGKTTILYKLQCGEVVSTIPTIGFNVECVTYKNIKFQVWDLGGQTTIRPYWRCYFSNANAIMYVVDSSDTERMGVSKAELLAMLEEEELRDICLLVFANKQDLPGALAVSQVSEELGLSCLKGRQWSIFKTSAIKGEGIYEGLDWLINALKNS